jgi:hypothetical protein
MKTAVKRGSGTLKTTQEINKSLETEKSKLVSELMKVESKLMKAESKVSFQSKVIDNNRKMIAKLKAPTGETGGKYGRNVAQLMKENSDLRGGVEQLTADVSAEKGDNELKQVLH